MSSHVTHTALVGRAHSQVSAPMAAACVRVWNMSDLFLLVSDICTKGDTG